MSERAKSFSIVFLMCLLAGACQRSETTNSSSTNQPTPTASASSNGASNLASAPIKLDDLQAAYAKVNDYTCLYEKQEKAISNGEPQAMNFYFRKPFDVKLEWVNGKGKVDQEAVYREGMNDGKILAKSIGGLGGLMGELRFAPTDALALNDSKHPVTEIGFGKLIETMKADAQKPDVTARYLGEETLDNRPAYKFEFVNASGSLTTTPDARRGLVWIDKELKMPAQVELYDAGQTLLERHRFKNVKLNVGLTDKTFTL